MYFDDLFQTPNLYFPTHRYLFETTMRYDGSSRFPTDSKYGFFPSLAAGSEIEQDWRDHNNCELFDDYFKNVNLHIAPGTMYSAGVRSDELQLVWTQVTTCIKEGSWKAIYASSDEEFDKIVADMVAQANEYGYDQCVEFQENEVTLRAAAEDAARAGEVVE